jgi:hypothetical protein
MDGGLKDITVTTDGHLEIKRGIEVIMRMLRKYINFLKRKSSHFSMMAMMMDYLSNGYNL